MSPSARTRATRIDQIWLTPAPLNRVQAIGIDAVQPGMDHAPVLVDFLRDSAGATSKIPIFKAVAANYDEALKLAQEDKDALEACPDKSPPHGIRQLISAYFEGKASVTYAAPQPWNDEPESESERRRQPQHRHQPIRGGRRA